MSEVPVMKGKNITVLLLAGAMVWSLCSCQTSQGEAAAPEESLSASTPAPSMTAEPTSTAVGEQEQAFSFADLKGYEFQFRSGAGAWGTALSIREDGSFSGTYSDTDMGGEGDVSAIQYRCDFTGQLTQPEKVNDYTYSVRIAEIHYAHAAGTDEIADGFHYYYTDPNGLVGAEEILIYLPGAPLDQMTEEFLSWVIYETPEDGKLPFYALNNQVEQQGFVGVNLAEAFRENLVWTEEYAAELETEIKEDTSLTQGDLNAKSQELYELWDGRLNELWGILKELLPEEDMEALRAEEVEWIAWKEAQAAQAGEEFGGGSLAIIVQSQRAAELTRERVYQLLELLEE